MKKLLSILFHPVLLLIVGLALMAGAIWIAGPLMSFARSYPLESRTARFIAIGCVALVVILRRIWVAWRARRTQAALSAGLAAHREAPRAAAAPTPGETEIATLSKRFDEALAVLREARITASGKKPGWRDWVTLSGRQYLYQLPWYMFIGAPGAGKTTALIHSGLRFPLAERFGTDKIRGVGGTRNCDWWFTDDAVLIDTAGRYTTHESDRDADQAAWQGFLALLKKTRPRQPVNGVLMTLAVPDLIAAMPANVEEMASTLRARMRELMQAFGTRFPVYVLVTKTDLLAGFTEFFADMPKEERAQVFGFTFPYDPKHPLTESEFGARVDAELDALEARLVTRLPERLNAETGLAQRAAIVGFPQQFAALKPALAEALRATFMQSKHDDIPLVRGVYFTSGTQEGTPIDRVMGSLARAFGVERGVQPPRPSSGRSYFIERLLTQVVFAEQGLAGSNLRWARRRHLWRLSAYAAIAAVSACVLALWGTSYLRNRIYVASVDQAAHTAQQAVAGTSAAGTSLVALLPLLSAVRQLASTRQVDAARPPLSMQWGLWQGAKLDAAASDAYERLLTDLFLPKLAARIEEQARSANRANPGYAYEALKAYLMLNQPEHQDPDALKTWIVTDWERSLPREVGNEQRAALAGHLDALLARGVVHPNLPFDERLVAHLRTMLAASTLAQRVYGRVKQQGVGANYPEFTVAHAGGPNASLVFVRASGMPLTRGVPGLYSFDGYHKAFLSGVDQVAVQLATEEPWVLGIRDQSGLPRGDPAATQRLTEDVRLLYLQDYARIWNDFLNDIRIVHADSLAQSAQIARILSAPDSPLAMLAKAASRETSLATRPENETTVVDKANDKISAAREQLLKIIGGPDPTQIAPVAPGTRLESIVDDRFAGLRALVTSPGAGQPAPITQTLALINDVYASLSATDEALQQKTAPPPSDAPAKLRAQAARLPEPIRTALLDLGSQGAAQTQQARRVNLSADLKESIASFCERALKGRYPFNPNSARDVLPEDFGALFAPGGKFDDFFQKNLAADVDVSAKPWAFRKSDSSATQISPAGLAQFERAATIRGVFFRAGGKTPALALQFKPLDMDPTILSFTLDVDGQVLTYAHGPQIATAIQWPGTRGSGRVSVQLSPPPGGGASDLVFEGPWALFRMFDRLDVQSTEQPERFIATFDVEGRKARFEVTANSVENPFRLADLRAFSCPERL
ncbi:MULTISPECIES: type VI secretion system membrane subunit TssM [unclassified Caballeronia]|uniref:type VI secretion system membrane subunit TssM n=1 Tax=unclassified Caballeronia TaxID=2646786 RepID=UPI0028621D6D|nr:MULTISPECIES: type VI secretion system membrane subunit TssM [unclassified Caballeronia]MDR5753774.1 type VI secretion system membrane subunit TssM [Caballeronia sp. LZ024]MDR5840153.1 type VI secretion system membrane subunit TssM [Caballeronia sp. LZ031]